MTHHARVSLEPAWILHHYPYRDSSLLLEVFSREYGRVGLIARGARSAKGRWQNQLQMLRPLMLSWNMRGELGTLTGVDSRGCMDVFPGRQVLCACYLNELLMRLLTRHDPHPELFAAYEDALLMLGTAEEQALRLFEKRLLQALGYGLLLDCEYDSGAAVLAENFYEYRLEKGPVRCRQPTDNGVFLRGASLLALHRDNLQDPQACREVKKLMRAALALYLGERPLRTREVLRQLSTFSAAGRAAVMRNSAAQDTG
ncbi:MAG: DNA repair protein RecO [Gammaproteobacteria bacterium]|nr:DNA repair protein RecO [Gammaproteobacteria bacterium]